MLRRVLLVLGLVGLLAAGSGFSAQVTEELLKAKIDFQFTAGGVVLPPGEYDFRTANSEQVIRIQGEGKNSAIVNVVTRMAAGIHSTPQDSHVVFDQVGDTYTLSELWIPGQDGYALLATKAKHGHKILNIQK